MLLLAKMKLFLFFIITFLNHANSQFFKKNFDFSEICRSDGAKHESLDKLTYSNEHLILSSAKWSSQIQTVAGDSKTCSFSLNYKTLATPIKRGQTFVADDDSQQHRPGTDSVIYDINIINQDPKYKCAPGTGGTLHLLYQPDNGLPVDVIEPLCSKIDGDTGNDVIFSRQIVSRNPLQISVSDLTLKSIAANNDSLSALPFLLIITSKSNHPDVKAPSIVPAIPSSLGNDGSQDKDASEGNEVQKITYDENGNRLLAVGGDKLQKREAEEELEIKDRNKRQTLYPNNYNRYRGGYNQGYPYNTPYGSYQYGTYNRGTGRRIARIGGGIIAAIVIACLLCCGVCFGICYYLCSKRGENTPSWMKGMPAIYRQDAPPAGNVNDYQVGGPQYAGQPPPGGYYTTGQPNYQAMSAQSYPINPMGTGMPPYPTGPTSQMPYPQQPIQNFSVTPSAPSYTNVPYPSTNV